VVTGRAVVNSGFPSGQRFRPTFTFPRAGVYHFTCIPHPGMTGTVRVLPRRAGIPSRTVQARLARAQLRSHQAALVARIRRVAAAPGAATVWAGVGTRTGARFALMPRLLTVRAGTTVTFRMGGRSEIHTATFGPVAQRNRLVAAFEGPTVPAEVQYPSDPPAAPAVVTPTAHGVGLVNSGILFDPGTAPPGGATTWRATFPVPGAYEYICIVHPTMVGSITVTP
jgi:plastocyanin